MVDRATTFSDEFGLARVLRIPSLHLKALEFFDNRRVVGSILRQGSIFLEPDSSSNQRFSDQVQTD